MKIKHEKHLALSCLSHWGYQAIKPALLLRTSQNAPVATPSPTIPSLAKPDVSGWNPRFPLGRGHTLQKNRRAPLLQICASPEVLGTLGHTHYCLHFHSLLLRLGAPTRWDPDPLFYMGKAGRRSSCRQSLNKFLMNEGIRSRKLCNAAIC